MIGRPPLHVEHGAFLQAVPSAFNRFFSPEGTIHAERIAMARKNKLDLTVGIAMGSSIQIALFVAPVLVLASGFVAPQP